jgi:hypothetical protein
VLLSALLVGSVLLCCDTAAGQEPCNRDHPDGCVILAVGKQAPFSGMLLNVRRASDLTVRAEMCQERIDAAVDEERERAVVKLQAEKDRRVSDKDACTIKLSAMRSGMEAYEAAFAPHWYEHPVIWFAVGVGLTIATIAGSVEIIDKTRPAVVQVQ